jgi:hypothetical protein
MLEDAGLAFAERLDQRRQVTGGHNPADADRHWICQCGSRSKNPREYQGKCGPASLHRVSVPSFFLDGILSKLVAREIAALSRCPKESAIAAAAMATQSRLTKGMGDGDGALAG